MNPLKCPVCNSPLERVEKTYRCENKHSFDIAKKGFANLLLANQWHGGNEGDSEIMIQARKRFLETGKYDCLRNRLKDLIDELTPENGSFLDIACGEGHYTNFIHQEIQKKKKVSSFACDISKAGILKAATSRNILGLLDIDYFIGNLDYLPFLDDSMDTMLNCFAPINGDEFRRVCKTSGHYIRVLPDVYHLYELKEFLYSDVRLNEPKEPEIEGFEMVGEEHIEDEIELNNQEIADLFMMTPYFYKTSPEAKMRLAKLNELKTRIAFVIRVYKKK